MNKNFSYVLGAVGIGGLVWYAFTRSSGATSGVRTIGTAQTPDLSFFASLFGKGPNGRQTAANGPKISFGALAAKEGAKAGAGLLGGLISYLGKLGKQAINSITGAGNPNTSPRVDYASQPRAGMDPNAGTGGFDDSFGGGSEDSGFLDYQIGSQIGGPSVGFDDIGSGTSDSPDFSGGDGDAFWA